MPQMTRKEKKKISLRQYDVKEKDRGNYSPGEALFHALQKGSFTLEASLVLPLFLFAAATVLSLFLMMQVQYTVENALERAVADQALLGSESEKTVENLAKAAFYQELVRQNCMLTLIQGKAAGFSWKGTKIDSVYIDVLVTYQLKIPLHFWGKRTMKVSDSCRMHRWTGNQRGEGGSEKEEWVFITPNQSVYHKNRVCSHLKLSVKTLNASKLKLPGNNYSACGHCTRGQKRGAVVYVTEEGKRFHYRIDCSGLKRTIYMVKKREAGGKRPCSRCGGS